MVVVVPKSNVIKTILPTHTHPKRDIKSINPHLDHLPQPRPYSMATPLAPLLLLLFLSPLLTVRSSPIEAYPSPYLTDAESCGAADPTPVPVRREVYANGRIIDITHKIREDLPAYKSPGGLGKFIWLHESMKNGSLCNISEIKFVAHTGTHVDAPGHMFDEYYDAGFDVDTLDLEVLNGPALLVDAPRDKNITAEAMESMHIPRGVQRVLFRTLNTDRKLMWNNEFDTTFVGFTEGGAQWLVDNTDIKLIGVDYLSVASFDHLFTTHHVLLRGREIILVEGLKLDDIDAGMYNVHCLPLRLPADGSPIRCILIK